jgi:hypothetical protein
VLNDFFLKENGESLQSRHTMKTHQQEKQAFDPSLNKVSDDFLTRELKK